MKKLFTNTLLITILSFTISCQSPTDKANEVTDLAIKMNEAVKDQPATGSGKLSETFAQDAVLLDTASKKCPPQALKSESVKLTESKNEKDEPINDYLTEQLKPIRENFHKINSISQWSSVDKRKLELTPENGLAEYYYIDGKLQKIIARYPKTKQISEYYLLNGQLSFVVLKSVQFEGNSEELITDKNYFKNSKLIHKIYSQDCGAPFADDYLVEEQKLILGAFKKIKARINK
ncbi:MAG: hypothetical protein Q8M29_19190 [Bacteroidota bacterium]|nr:hypothetical protein [Bacteroidota bacterium]